MESKIKDDGLTDELPVLTEVDEFDEFGTTSKLDHAAVTGGEGDGIVAPEASLDARLADRDATIASLEERLAATRDAVRRRDATERTLRRHLTEADRVRAMLEARVKTLEGTVTERDARLADMQTRLDAAASAATTPRVAAAARPPAAPPRKPAALASTEAAAEPEAHDARDAYAALAAYVDGRQRFWDAQCALIADLEARIRELEAETAQRSRRERQATDAAHREARRSQKLTAALAAVRSELRETRARARAASAMPARLSRPDRPPSAAGTVEATQATGATKAATGDLKPRHARQRVMLCLAQTPPTEYPVTGPIMTIGRGPECDIPVATHFISREHARLCVSPERVTIEDLGSRNGVLVNSIRVERAILQSGDFLTLGDTLFRYFEE